MLFVADLEHNFAKCTKQRCVCVCVCINEDIFCLVTLVEELMSKNTASMVFDKFILKKINNCFLIYYTTTKFTKICLMLL